MNLRIGKYKSIDVVVFKRLFGNLRNSSLIDFHISWSLDYDHSPQFSVYLGILKWSIVDFTFYDVRHKEEE